METTMKNAKHDIVSEAVEALDYHIEQNERLKQQQLVLFCVSGFLLLLNII